MSCETLPDVMDSSDVNARIGFLALAKALLQIHPNVYRYRCIGGVYAKSAALGPVSLTGYMADKKDAPITSYRVAYAMGNTLKVYDINTGDGQDMLTQETIRVPSDCIDLTSPSLAPNDYKDLETLLFLYTPLSTLLQNKLGTAALGKQTDAA